MRRRGEGRGAGASKRMPPRVWVSVLDTRWVLCRSPGRAAASGGRPTLELPPRPRLASPSSHPLAQLELHGCRATSQSIPSSYALQASPCPALYASSTSTSSPRRTLDPTQPREPPRCVSSVSGTLLVHVLTVCTAPQDLKRPLRHIRSTRSHSAPSAPSRLALWLQLAAAPAACAQLECDSSLRVCEAPSRSAALSRRLATTVLAPSRSLAMLVLARGNDSAPRRAARRALAFV